MAGIDGVTTAQNAADFLEQIYAAEAQGKRIVVTGAQVEDDNGRLAGFSVSWKSQSKAARVFRNIFSVGGFGREQDEKVIVALRSLAEASFGVNPTNERHQEIIRQLSAGETAPHQNNVVSSFIRKLGLTPQDFSSGATGASPNAPRPVPVADRQDRSEPVTTPQLTTSQPSSLQIRENEREPVERPPLQVASPWEQATRRQADEIRRRSDEIQVSMPWIWKGFDREAVIKAYRDNPTQDLTVESIQTATRELYLNNPEWQNQLQGSGPKPVREHGSFVDYYHDPNRAELGVVAGFDLQKSASAQNVGKVWQALGDPLWVNEQVRQIAAETGQTIDFSVRKDERSDILNYTRQKLIEHLPSDPNKSVDINWVKGQFKTQFLKAWARGESQSAQLVAERQSDYSKQSRAQVKAFTERYARAASDQLDNIIQARTGVRARHQGPVNSQLEQLLDEALQGAQEKFGIEITAEDLAEPKFRADFLKAVRSEIKYRDLTGDKLPFLRAPSERDWVDSILVRALGSAAAQRLPDALKKIHSSHPEQATAFDRRLVHAVASNLENVTNRYDLPLSLDDFRSSGARENYAATVLDAMRWTRVGTSQPNRSESPDWFKNVPGSVFTKALVEVFVPESVSRR